VAVFYLKFVFDTFQRVIYTAVSYNVLRLGGRFNAAKPLLYAGTVD